MAALLLVAHPGALLAVGHGLKGKAAEPEADAQEVGWAEACGAEGGGGHGVEGDGGEADEGAPGGLGHPGDEELWRGLFDFVEARVVALGEDSLEEIGSHFGLSCLV